MPIDSETQQSYRWWQVGEVTEWAVCSVSSILDNNLPAALLGEHEIYEKVLSHFICGL